MALVKFGGGIAGISGKIGGTVYARNKAGAFARNWSKPVNPGTVRQSEVRGIFGSNSAAWSALTGTNRDSWNAYAATQTRVNRIGETYVPSGRQVFLEVNNSLTQAGEPMRSTPDVSAAPPPAIFAAVLTVTETAGALTALSLDYQMDGPPPSTGLIIEAAPVQTGAKQNVNTQFRQISSIPAAPGTPANLLTAYTAVFGSVIAAGEYIHLRVQSYDSVSGLRSSRVLVVEPAA